MSLSAYRVHPSLVVRALLGLALLLGPASVAWARTEPDPAADHPLHVSDISLDVTLSQDATLPGSLYRLKGTLFQGPEDARTVVLLVHGLSYAGWVWDLPARVDPHHRYSVARALAGAGVDVVAVDLPGVGASAHPQGLDARQLSVWAYAAVVHQVVQDLRTRYARVVVVGHSAGAEVAELEAGRYDDVAGLGVLGMCDVGASPAAVSALAGNDLSDAGEEYAYFGGTPATREALMYASADADPQVVAADQAMAELSPESEMQSVSLQPARQLDAEVAVPVLVAFGEQDALFPPPCQALQARLFVSSPKVTTFVLSGAGHALMLHRNAADLQAALRRWVADLAAASRPHARPR